MLFEISLGLQNIAETVEQDNEGLSNTQANSEMNKTEVNDDPGNTVFDKESQKVGDRWADKRFNEFDDRGAVFGKGKDD